MHAASSQQWAQVSLDECLKQSMHNICAWSRVCTTYVLQALEVHQPPVSALDASQAA